MNGYNIKGYNVIFPLFLAAFLLQFWGLAPYYDDIHRFSSNTTNLANQGRPLTEWLYFSYDLFNSHVFPNLYNFNLLAIWSIAVFSYNLFSRYICKDNDTLVAIVFICIFSVPGIIQSIAFHVDNIGMITSIMLSLMAGAYVEKFSIRNVILQTIALCGATMFYQLSFNYYISAFVIFMMVKCYQDNISLSRLLKTCLIKSMPLVASVSLALIYKHYYAHDPYFIEHSSFMSLNDIKDGRLIRNINVMFWALSLTYNNLQWFLFKALITASAISWLTCIYISFIKTNWSAFITLLLAPIIVLMMVVLPSLLIYHPVIEQRTLTTISMVIALLLFLSVQSLFTKKIAIAIVALLSITNIMLASAFVSTQSYSNERTTALLKDVYFNIPERFFTQEGSVNISIPMSRTPRASGEMINNFTYFPSLRMMVMDYFYSEYQTNALMRYNNIGMTVSYTKDTCETGTIVNRKLYTIKECKGLAYVQFK
ncbi:TPA: glucosyltransferase domain-containing protein [Escherichia coli]